MLRRRVTGGLLGLLSLALLASAAGACGFIMCEPPITLPEPQRARAQVTVRKLTAKVQVDNVVARVKIEQEFENATPWELEGRYVFPLPKGASVASFAMIVDGKRIKAEVTEKEAARREFQELIRQRRDPALLEFLGGDVFQASVGPIPPGQRRVVELVYESTLEPRTGLFEVTLPLKAARSQISSIPVFAIEGKISTDFPLQNVYSPTHDVVLDRHGARRAKFSFEAENMGLDKDFTLYFSATQKDLGLSVMTHRVAGEDGYFMLMISPPTEGSAEAVARDVTLVADVSGSMRGGKIEQARRALDFVVSKLQPEDRFELVTFSSGVTSLTKGLWPADAAHKQKAAGLIQGIQARGGTNIHAAMLRGLKARSNDRPHVLVFLTDGEPTEGVTDTDAILQAVEKANGGDSRVFLVGIGFNLNVKLLDGLSGRNRGSSLYVKPEQKIDEEIGRWYARVSHPVLTDLALDMGSIETEFTYPEAMPDLYAGDQLLLVGRYRTHGKALVKLRGRAGAGRVEHLYDVDFPAEELERDFLPRLWARRRVGYLLDKIRLLGEKQELKDEVMTLAKEYSIVTPYTSFLVRGPQRPAEKAKLVRPPRMFRPDPGPSAFAPPPGAVYKGGGGGSGFGAAAAPSAPQRLRRAPSPASAPEPAGLMDAFSSQGSAMADGAAMDALGGVDMDMEEDAGMDLAPMDARAESEAQVAASGYSKKDLALGRMDLNATSGKAAVEAAERLRDMKESSTLAGESGDVRHVSGKTLRLVAGVWTDDELNMAPKLPVLEVAFGSDAYFALLAVKPGLAKILGVGELVDVLFDGVRVRVSRDGARDLTEEAVRAVFQKAAGG